MHGVKNATIAHRTITARVTTTSIFARVVAPTRISVAAAGVGKAPVYHAQRALQDSISQDVR